MTGLFDFPSFSNKVLIIDDEPMILKLLGSVVQSHGYEQVTAGSAEEALPLIEQDQFAGMLIDKNLPGIDGIELMRGVKMAQPHCACIIITGFPSRDSAIEALHLGAADYIGKPFDDILLIANSLERAVDRARLEYESHEVKKRLIVLAAADGIEGVDEKTSLMDALNRVFDRPKGGG